MTQLNIFYDKDEVGILKYEPIDDVFSFEYSDDWKIKGFELSPYMKFDSVISNNVIKNFFSYGWLRFILISLVSEIILFISIYYLGMDRSERQSIKRYIILGIRKLQIRHSSTPVAP